MPMPSCEDLCCVCRNCLGDDPNPDYAGENDISTLCSLPCGHYFHQACLCEEELRRTGNNIETSRKINKCPACRAPFEKYNVDFHQQWEIFPDDSASVQDDIWASEQEAAVWVDDAAISERSSSATNASNITVCPAVHTNEPKNSTLAWKHISCGDGEGFRLWNSADGRSFLPSKPPCGWTRYIWEEKYWWSNDDGSEVFWEPTSTC